jgi:hypothetical protein
VIGTFLTNRGNDPFKAGDITMIVYDVANGVPGNALWRPGFVPGQGTTYLPAAQNNSIQSDPIAVTGNQVLVELRIKMFGPDHDVDPKISTITFGTAAIFQTPAKGALRVDVDVVRSEREFTVDAADEASAEVEARNKITDVDIRRMTFTKSIVKLAQGRFRVALAMWTKDVLIHHPGATKVIY